MKVLAVLLMTRILLASVLLNGPWYLSTARTGQNGQYWNMSGQIEETAV